MDVVHHVQVHAKMTALVTVMLDVMAVVSLDVIAHVIEVVQVTSCQTKWLSV